MVRYSSKKKVEMNIHIRLENLKPTSILPNDTTLSETFTFKVHPDMSIMEIREFIIGAINAIEDENPDTDETRIPKSYSDLKYNLYDFSCNLR